MLTVQNLLATGKVTCHSAIVAKHVIRLLRLRISRRLRLTTPGWLDRSLGDDGELLGKAVIVRNKRPGTKHNRRGLELEFLLLVLDNIYRHTMDPQKGKVFKKYRCNWIGCPLTFGKPSLLRAHLDGVHLTTERLNADCRVPGGRWEEWLRVHDPEYSVSTGEL